MMAENLRRGQHVWWEPGVNVDLWGDFNGRGCPIKGPYAAKVHSTNPDMMTVMLVFFNRDHQPNTNHRLVPWAEVREREVP